MPQPTTGGPDDDSAVRDRRNRSVSTLGGVPFTVSHPAAVLPLRRLGLPMTVLVVASMVPDVPVFLGRPRVYEVTHSLVGIVTIDLVMAVTVVAWWSFVMRDALVDLAPTPVRSRFAAHVRPSRRDWLLSPLAAVIGALTHVAWDSFTHAGEWGVVRIDWLQAQHGGLVGFKWAQYASGAIGLAVVGIAALNHLRALHPIGGARDRRVLPPATLPVTIGLVALAGIVSAARHVSSGLHSVAFNGAVDSLIVLAVALTALTLAWNAVAALAVAPGMTVIALTGATGAVGGTAAHLLADAGRPVRLLVRDTARAPSLQGADVRQATYGQDGCVQALEGVDTVFMVSGHEAADRLDQHRTFVDAAVTAGVRQIVYLSFVGASATSGFTLGRDHGATEDHIRASGLEWTFVRDNFYAEILPQFADEAGVIRGPAGSGRVAAVSQRDVGAVVAHVLTDPREHAGRSYDLTGPDALTFDEVATILTRITGRPYSFVDETVDEARASRAHFGAPGWQVDAWISTYTAIRDGELEHVSGDIARLLDRPATSFDEAIAEQA
jgi:NAD(P)H dehydrogenase (quinone)